MDYVKSNKAAWEEAYDHRKPGWCDNICDRLQNESYPCFEKEFIKILEKFDFTGKTVAQFCCNNGRELLSLVKAGAKRGTGFDIAENMIAAANETARKTGIACDFVATDILEIGAQYDNEFDVALITIGALTWFKDLVPFFEKAARCLKTGGMLFIHEQHPVTNMMGVAGEDNYDEKQPEKLVNSYFRQEPWIDNSGMSYLCGEPYESKTFCCYTHTFSAIINAMSANHLAVSELHEYPLDISGSFGALDNRGIPLSYSIVAIKKS